MKEWQGDQTCFPVKPWKITRVLLLIRRNGRVSAYEPCSGWQVVKKRRLLVGICSLQAHWLRRPCTGE